MPDIQRPYESPNEDDFVAPGARPSPQPEVRRDLFEQEIRDSREPGPEMKTTERPAPNTDPSHVLRSDQFED
ncbi:MAG TPA: hypothetical protein VMU94_11545 [Streptosporangiaceae bacterium]|nr:hypothetical protein [Streptosporangiaceae bacterium]